MHVSICTNLVFLAKNGENVFLNDFGLNRVVRNVMGRFTYGVLVYISC